MRWLRATLGNAPVAFSRKAERAQSVERHGQQYGEQDTGKNVNIFPLSLVMLIDTGDLFGSVSPVRPEVGVGF